MGDWTCRNRSLQFAFDKSHGASTMSDSFDKMILKDGRVGTIAEVLEPGIASEFERSTRDDGTALDITTAYQDEVAAVFEPFSMAEC